MSLNWKKDDIDVKISRLLDTIVNLANEDNVISDDEDVIIEAARKKLWGLHKEFEKMISQQLSLDDAKAKTKTLVEQVIFEVTEAAKKDSKITSDELILIDRISKFLRNTDFAELLK